MRTISPKERKYVAGLLEGKTKRKAALNAGFSVSMADNAKQKIEQKPSVQQLLKDIIAATGVSDEELAVKTKEAICAGHPGGSGILRVPRSSAGSCGQIDGTPRESLSPEYKSWCGMVQRCLNPNNKSFGRYGGRGIRICARWRRSFLTFLEDMGRKPSKEHSIDRIDNSGPYCIANCRWATPAEQRANQGAHDVWSCDCP